MGSLFSSPKPVSVEPSKPYSLPEPKARHVEFRPYTVIEPAPVWSWAKSIVVGILLAAAIIIWRH